MTTAPTRRLRKDAASNRAEILAAAAATFASDPNASIDTIARAAGLTRRALYGHFDDRDALLREVVRLGAEQFNRIALEAPRLPAPQALAHLAGRLWAAAAHVPLAAALALDDAHIEVTASALAPLRARVLEIARDGQAHGLLRTDIPAQTLARLIEETARTAVTRFGGEPDAAGLAARIILGVAGLGWRDAGAVVEETS